MSKRYHDAATWRESRPHIPAMEGAALGGDAVVDVRVRVEGEGDAAAAEAAEQVAEEVELEEAVQEGGGEDEGGDRVVRGRHQRRRAEQQLAGRLAAGGRHRSEARLRRALGRCRHERGVAGALGDGRGTGRWRAIRVCRVLQLTSHERRARCCCYGQSET